MKRRATLRNQPPATHHIKAFKTGKSSQVRFVFGTLDVETRTEIIHKTVTSNLKKAKYPKKMTKPILTILLFLSIHIVCGQENITKLEGLEQEIETLMDSYKAVGLSISVVKDNQIVYSKGFGYRDLENKLPVNENTVFPIASCSKAFTASLLGILDSQNKISLKDRPSFYVPKLEFYNSQMNDLITIEDLLSHKSGLGDLNGTLVLFPEENSDMVVQKLKYLQPEGLVNDSWIYSNMGYTIAGTIIEKVTDRSWEENLQSKIFNPLNMLNSYTDIESMTENKNFSFGYGLSNGEIKKVIYEEYYNYKAAGAVRSSSKDMASWMIAWLNEGNFNGKQILPKTFVQNATTIHNIRPNANEENAFLFGDGLGWRMEASSGKYKVYHGGNTSGFSSLVLTYPFEKLGVTVLSNQTNSILPYIIADVVKNRMLNLDETDVSDYPVNVTDIYVPSETNTELNPEKKPTHNLSSFIGKYENYGYGTIEIKLKDGNLYALYPKYQFFLEHLYFNIFVMIPKTEISQVMNPEFAISFKTNNRGEISSLMINLQSKPVAFTKQIEQ
ncbi:serine hydrolase [Flavobacteriaceae bacterium TP-CH-4]|uniref:Serine hydrolase n=1 Tax=Pelagihabitans pacificus TaxID=2696054 RepID=A0A967AX85_9FLAO|nr:serine hydrolase [Pelagihabitans pacificus]NHF61582.1 serine hydrolase [Pelagihabitans pacificus]